jgi:hypothetical protein
MTEKLLRDGRGDPLWSPPWMKEKIETVKRRLATADRKQDQIENEFFSPFVKFV